jgi:hypothetical protein
MGMSQHCLRGEGSGSLVEICLILLNEKWDFWAMARSFANESFMVVAAKKVRSFFPNMSG